MTKPKYPELITNIAEILALLLSEKGLDQDQAASVATQVAEMVRVEFGGQLIYIPKGTAFDSSERDAEVCRKFDGKNVTELAREYDLTEQTVYRILARARSALRRSQRANG